MLLLNGCGEDGSDASARVSPSFGSSLEVAAAWTNDYWSTYDGYGGLLKHATSGSEVLWGWDFLASTLTPAQRTSSWLWSERIEVDGREYWYGYSDTQRLEVWRMDTSQIAILTKTTKGGAGALLGAVMMEWDALTAIRTTDTFIE
ncbi:MAG: hypothetical protein O3A20_07010 [Planctomycetota bacterium]|nr:hypothetical protein [Planctomycetota bacterium]